MPEINYLLLLLIVPAALWCIIAAAGSVPVLSLHKAELMPLPEDQARRILTNVLLKTPDFDSDWLRDEGFRALGVYRASGLLGNPKIVAWEHQQEATWLCGYLLTDESCQMDLVSLLGDATLTTGTTKDGHLFPADTGRFTQTFGLNSLRELLVHHRQALRHLAATRGLDVDDRAPAFSEAFASALRSEGEFIRSILLWPVRIPWWYFTRRRSRHDRTIEQLYG